MKMINGMSKTMGTVLAAAAVALSGAAIASANPNVAGLGAPQKLVDGAVVSTYAVSGLQPSNDVVNVPLGGRLWEATTTITATEGSVTPAIPFFNARNGNGDNYRVLFQALAPEGVSAATLDQGGSSTGKIYFDVTGAAPTSVVYNDAVQDRLIWN